MKTPLLVLVFFLITHSPAQALEGLYLSGNAGISIMDRIFGEDLSTCRETPKHKSLCDSVNIKNLKNGLMGSLAVGWDYGSSRWELQLSHRRNEVGTITGQQFPGKNPGQGDAVATAILFNGFYQIENSTQFTPYIGAGFGFALVDIDFGIVDQPKLVDESNFALAWQFNVGTEYEVSESWAIGLNYSFFSLFDTKYKKGPGFGLDSVGREEYEM